MTMDPDSTVCQVHGHAKQGAAYGYTHTLGYQALLHSVRSRHAEAAADIQDQITRASSSNATVSRRFAGSSTASS
jgi:hypothetical protein